MTTVTIGQTNVTRIKEMYTAGWDAPAFFPDWRPDAVKKHLSWMVPHHFDRAKSSLKLSIDSWFLRIGLRTVLVDTLSAITRNGCRVHGPERASNVL